MSSKLWFKLTAAFLLVAVVVVTVVAILANRATNAGFHRFLSQDSQDETARLQQELADHYQQYGGWEGVEPLLQTYRSERGVGSGGGSITLLDQNGRTVISLGGGRGQRAASAGSGEGLPIHVAGQQVGTLIVGQPGVSGGRAGEQFLADVNSAIVYAGVAAIGLALILGVLLARGLTRPLQQLTRATRALAQGELDQKVTVAGRDELGELAGSFNQMAEALKENEIQRRQLFADIAHELRTPLSVVRGQLEGMLDGIFDMTPENLGVVHEETILLSQLVDELRTLSLAESGQLPLDKRALDLTELLLQATAAFEPLAEAEGVDLQLALVPDLPHVTADPGRLQQVLGNLLSNALRHAVKAGGPSPEVRLWAEPVSGAVRVGVSDNGPGLSAEARLHVFDRFWRADASRSRDNGGSGLGLAICRGIIQAHGGSIWVDSEPGHGATFVFELPTG